MGVTAGATDAVATTGLAVPTDPESRSGSGNHPAACACPGAAGDPGTGADARPPIRAACTAPPAVPGTAADARPPEPTDPASRPAPGTGPPARATCAAPAAAPGTAADARPPVVCPAGIRPG